MKILTRILIALFLLQGNACTNDKQGESRTDLENKFENPPQDAKLKAYWWWINGHVDKEAITRDLDAMKDKGLGGAVLCDVDRSYVRGNKQIQHGPDFMSPEWRELYKYTLKEANRLGLEISLNISSGWAVGGPMIEMKDAPKVLTWATETAKGPKRFNKKLALPALNEYNTVLHRSHEKPDKIKMDSLYCDILIVAYPKNKIKKIKNWEIKGLHKPMHSSAPKTGELFEHPMISSDHGVINKNDIIDLSEKISPSGKLIWDIPEGEWEILRLGYTTYAKGVKWSSSEGWEGFPIDVFDAEVFGKYWDAVVAPLIKDAGDLAGTTLKYLHSDSWELEPINWTPTFREEFKKRRGYDILAYAPALIGNIVESPRLSDRFLHDFRKTFGDLVIDNYYKPFKERSHQHNILIHPESGGPHAVPIDAQRCLGYNDIPMSEFWARSWTHRITDEQRFFVKQPASAAHTYGKNIVMAEGFTTIGPNWQETIWDNLKPSFDKAICEGMNQLVWHEFSCSPKSTGMPGQEAYAGTHFNPNQTWWSRSEAFLSYINRCQAMMQHGLFVADVAFYYGDHVPNFAQLKSSDPCGILPGYDYDVVTEEVILERMDVSNGKIVLPDGMNYKVLVLPEYPGFSLPVLKKVKELIQKGAIVTGPRPEYMNGLTNCPEADMEFKKLIDELWGKDYSAQSILKKKIGNGYMYAGIEVPDLLKSMGIEKDFSYTAQTPASQIDYIHRSDPSLDIYFISNRKNEPENINCKFRVSGKQPEFWDPVTGKKWNATEWSEENGHTQVPVHLSPYGSLFIVFANDGTAPEKENASSNFPSFKSIQTLEGSWDLYFDKKWGGPGSVTFDKLDSWTSQPEPGIKYYSGTVTYKKTFSLEYNKDETTRYYLDLGDLRELAEVRLNGKNTEILWAPPFRLEITDILTEKNNQLEVDVVNFWPNRIIGDQFLPADKRYTQTNIDVFKSDSPLSPSGLMGPVSILILTNE